MKLITWIALSWLALMTTAQAASVGCMKATSIIEKLICGNDELLKLDEKLNSAYKIALKDKKQIGTIKRHQKKWIIERNVCTDISCLQDKYTARIMQLTSVNKIEIQLPKEAKSDACQSVVDHSNRGELTKIYLSSAKPLKTTAQEVGRIFGLDDFGISSIRDETLWQLDLDNDGIHDYFSEIISGSGMIASGYFLSGVKGSTALTTDGFDYGSFTVITVNGENFILTGNFRPNRIGGLLKLSKDGKFKQICRFVERDKPLHEITRGETNPVCFAISSPNNIKNINFNSENNILDKNRTITGSVLVDLDNDGEPDNVAIVNFVNAVGSYCESSEIKIVDPFNSKIADSYINKIISDFLYDCDITQSAFIYDGLTYIDEQSNDGSRAILLIKDKKGQKVCEFKGRILFDVEMME